MQPVGGDGIGAGARQEVKQGLFLNGVDVFGNDSGVIEAVEGAVLVLPDVTEPPFARIDLALVGAQKALDLLIRRTFPKSGLVHKISLGVIQVTIYPSGADVEVGGGQTPASRSPAQTPGAADVRRNFRRGRQSPRPCQEANRAVTNHCHGGGVARARRAPG